VEARIQVRTRRSSEETVLLVGAAEIAEVRRAGLGLSPSEIHRLDRCASRTSNVAGICTVSAMRPAGRDHRMYGTRSVSLLEWSLRRKACSREVRTPVSHV